MTNEWVADEDQCLVRCELGFADCDGQQDNGCEVATSDAQACGRCIDSCLSNLCQGAAACANVQADLWTIVNGFGQVNDLTVAADGQVFVSLDTSNVNLPVTPIGPTTARALVSLADDSVVWASTAGETDERTLLTASTSDVRVLATPAGLYVLELFDTATLGGETFQSPSGKDMMLSLVTPAGERLWTRALGLAGGGISGLFTDEDSNAYVDLITSGEFNYGGVTIEEPLAYSGIFLSFSPTGDFRWAEELSPYILNPVSRGRYLTSSLLSSDTWRSAETGETGVDGVSFTTNGARGILYDAQGNLYVVGSTQSSRLSLQGGLPGFTGVEGAPGIAAPMNGQALFAAEVCAQWRPVVADRLGPQPRLFHAEGYAARAGWHPLRARFGHGARPARRSNGPGVTARVRGAHRPGRQAAGRLAPRRRQSPGADGVVLEPRGGAARGHPL